MIDISYRTHPDLYQDHKKCLAFLANIKAENYQWPAEVVKLHTYSEVTNRKQLLSIESYFATQDQEHTKLVLWSDWDVRDNPLLRPYRDRIDFRVFDPMDLANGTVLEGNTRIVLADDTKHYMRSGLLRFLALCKEGGIWFDMDMVLLRNLKPILDQEFAYVWAREFKDFSKHGPCAAFMGIKAGSDHALLCVEELAKTQPIPNSVARDCDMLAKVYAKRPFTVFPSAFFNTEWQIPDRTDGTLRDGWFVKSKGSDDLFLDAFAWHWHGSGGTRSTETPEPGSKFDQIRKITKARIKPSISFIFAARNDGYNNDLGVYKVPGTKDMNLDRIHAVIRALHYMDIPGQEIIIVDCFPPANRPSLRDLFSGLARVLTIPIEIRDLLYEQTPYRMPIYEFLAKHVGAVASRSDRLFFMNSDDILRRQGIIQTMRDIDDGWYCRADRIGIDPKVIVDDQELKRLVDDISPNGIPGIIRTSGAGGDYSGLRRDLYFRPGCSWRVAHGEWDLDAEMIRRLERNGIHKKQIDVFYHLEHYTAGVSQHRDTPNRPPRVGGEDHALIVGLDSIIDKILKYNEGCCTTMPDVLVESKAGVGARMPASVSVVPDESRAAAPPPEDFFKKYNVPKDYGPDHPNWNTPSKRNKYNLMMTELEERALKGVQGRPPMKSCIATMVSGAYQWYVPLFVDRIVKEYPEYDVKVLVRGRTELPSEYRKYLVEGVCDGYADSGYITAALRFVFGHPELEQYDNVLITDVDILIQRESPPLVEQHVGDLTANGLKCYSNYASTTGATGRMPGVHFVTKDWWKTTEIARAKYLKHLKEFGSAGDGFDETVIYRLVTESGLPVKKGANLWAHHGIHLGEYRKSGKLIPIADQVSYMKKLMDDNEFMNKIELCSEHIPEVRETIEYFKRFLA